MESIRQNPEITLQPDFRNLGTLLRTLLAANGLAFLAAFAANHRLVTLPQELLALAALVEPVLLFSVGAMALLQPLWRGLPPWAGGVLAMALAAIPALFLSVILLPWLGAEEAQAASVWRATLWAALGAAALWWGLHLRARLQSPALAEARLLALTARIRPHFLFNSLNGLLGVIRTDPRRAEAGLEQLAELFRALMRDQRELSPLSEEIALARQYLELERLRLGDRLQVHWHLDACPPDALVPPLMLQPLLENAVYHGVEPAATPAAIDIRFMQLGDRMLIELTNPRHPAERHGHGNRMALDNIRQRLMLYFDLEAQMEAGEHGEGGDRYRVRIVLPYRKERLCFAS